MGNYDYANAVLGGASSGGGHWPSVDPTTGLILKDPNHPTFYKTRAREAELGNAILPLNGRQYSVPTERKHMAGQYDQLFASPKFRAMVQQIAMQKKKKKLEDVLKQKEGRFAALGKKLPQYQVQRDKMKVEEAQRKAEQSKLDFMIKRAQESQKMQQEKEKQQQQMQ